MYNNFFGFRERPFKLVPDPAYLFLSKSHEEAMAHLTYAISQGEGFVELLGEVGTGKTTLCRAFLEKLDDTTTVAYIFNPKLDSLQLLKAINDEFGIDVKAETVKDLIDGLNAFLMEKKAEGQKVLLLIDEAQNLTEEVLEQLRLLSNLETNTDKLLQIILVGQPELGDMLDTHELRQIRQRITLSCCLKPFNFQETRAYIAHRIGVASQKSGTNFSRAAIRCIYRYSRGIPRLINIAADRSLLLAFSLDKHKVSRREAKAAAKELAGRGNISRYDGRREHRLVLMFLLLLAVIFIFFFYHFELPALTPLAKVKIVPKTAFFKISRPEKKAPTAGPLRESKTPASHIGVEKPSTTPAHEERSPDNLADLLRHMDAGLSREWALKAALKQWGTEATIRRYLKDLKNDTDFFKLATAQNGFANLAIKNDIELVKKLDLPAIIACYLPENTEARYVLISAIDDDLLTLDTGEENTSVELAFSELKSYWTGFGYIPWKNFLGLEAARPFKLSQDSVIALKIVLQDIGFNDIQINTSYDQKTRDAIKHIQGRHGLEKDAIVGPLTQIALYNEIKSNEIPHIKKQ